MPAIPATVWLLFAAAMVISSIGFKNYVWFISLGYGFSIAGEGLLMLLLFGEKLTLGTITLSFSGLAVAAVTGIVVNAILPGKDYEFSNSYSSGKPRSKHD